MKSMGKEKKRRGRGVEYSVEDLLRTKAVEGWEGEGWGQETEDRFVRGNPPPLERIHHVHRPESYQRSTSRRERERFQRRVGHARSRRSLALERPRVGRR